MSKLSPKALPSLFALSDAIRVFASSIGGTPVSSTNPEEILANANVGWNGATLGPSSQYKLPIEEEFNGLDYSFSYYIQQILQSGFSEWTTNALYWLTPSPSIVKDPSSSKLYISLKNSNTGNLLTDNASWSLLCDLNDLTLIAQYLKTFNVANGIPKLNSSNQYPALDGSLITNINNAQSFKKIILSNNVSTPNTKIDFSAGTFIFSDFSGSAFLSAITGDLSLNFGSGIGMLDTGSKANSTQYHCYAIYNPTTLTSKVICSTNTSSPALPSGYTKYTYLNTIMTNSSGNIIQFTQIGNRTELVSSIQTHLSVNQNNDSETVRSIAAAGVPLGRNVKAFGTAFCQYNAGGQFYFRVYSGIASKATLSNTEGQMSTNANSTGPIYGNGMWQVVTDTSSQIKTNSTGGASISFNICVEGWEFLN